MADFNNQIGESNETNNQKTDDCLVVPVADCDASNDWCSENDINKDGRIDIYDFAELCAHWLESEEPKYD